MEEHAQKQALTFGRYTITGPAGQLLRRTRPLPLSPKAVAVLWTLVSRRGDVVSKDELFTAVWPETVVSEGVLSNCIGELRRGLGDTEPKRRYIETVSRRGYRFLPPVTPQPWPEARAGGLEVVPAGQPDTGRVSEPTVWPPPPRAIAPVCLGREAELAQLHALFGKALHGERQVVFVTGEAGIGKTALVETFVQHLTSRCAQNHTPICIAQGQCIEHYGAVEAYLPLLDALGRLCRQAAGIEVLRVLQRVAPTWLVQLPACLDATDYAALQLKVAGAPRERMLRELVEALEALSAERMVLLVLEDLHWSDVSTIELLNFLARRRELARLLVLGTYRPVELMVQQHPLKTLKQELVAHGQGVELPLGMLRREAIEAYLAQRGTAPGQHAAVGAWVYRRTAGHPLFMVQVLDDLHQRGLFQALARGEAEASALEGAIPPGLQHLLEAQLERLEPMAQRVLEAASVVGPEFAVASVAAGLALDPEMIDGVCEAFVRQGQFLSDLGLVTWPDGTLSGRYGFQHTLYQEVLYQRLGTAQRARLHQRIGMRHEAGYATRASEWAAELAMHFARGRDARRAVQYWHQAGERALSRLAYREAVQCWEQALVALGELPHDRPAREQAVALRLNLARVLRALGHHASMLTHLHAAEAHAAALGEPDRLGRVYSGLATASRLLQDYTQALAYCQRAQDLATCLGDAALQAAVRHEMGLISYHLGDYQRAVTCLQPNLQAPQEAHEAATFGSLLAPAVQTWLWLVRCCSELGEFAAGLTYGEAALQRAEALALPPYERQTIYRRVGSLHLRQGTLPTAIALLEQAVAWSQEADLPVRAHLACRALALAYALAGRTPESLALLERLREDPQAHRDPLCGEAYLLVGEVGEAQQVAQRALANARQRQQRGVEVQALWLLGETARRHTPPDVAAAATAYQEALCLAKTLGMRPWQAHCHRGLGMLYAHLGQREQARTALSAALDLYRAMAMTLWLPQTEAALAQGAGASHAE